MKSGICLISSFFIALCFEQTEPLAVPMYSENGQKPFFERDAAVERAYYFYFIEIERVKLDAATLTGSVCSICTIFRPAQNHRFCGDFFCARLLSFFNFTYNKEKSLYKIYFL